MSQVIEFVHLLNFEDDFEILNQYPFTIRRKDDHYEIKDYIRSQGYVTVNLNQKSYDKHRLIALQFIPNDDPKNKVQVDHINRNKLDYHIENLRWVTISDNLKNRTKVKGVTYEFFTELPENTIKVLSYKSKYTFYEFEDDLYYYDVDNEDFYVKIKDNLYKKKVGVYVGIFDKKYYNFHFQ